MQKAIENFINLEMLKNTPLDKIEIEINKVEEVALQKAKKRQLRQWRKLNK
jgi:hypothetical protein